MSIVNTGITALGRLAALGLLAGAFLLGLAGVVYVSLHGSEVKVPEITGKNFSESEKELASLGLKIKKRADRFSAESPNTVIEQLPKPGETVKTGQLILVVTSKGTGEGDERPTTLKNTTEEDDTEKIEEMISDKPKKPKANSNTMRKKADTARDVNSDATDTNSNSNSADSNSNKKNPGANNNSSDKPNKNTQTPTINRLPNPATTKPVSGEPRVKPTTRP
ncbi:MAG: PASTA domain-containing protein [Pyrinomonadaceae bacterium]